VRIQKDGFMEIRRKLTRLVAVAMLLACAPAFALQSFGNLADKWGAKKDVPSSFAVLHYIHGAVETVIVQEALARKLNAGGARLCKLFKADGDLVEYEAEIVKKIVTRFAEVAKDSKYDDLSAPQMILMQMDTMYGCPEKK
jgi:hypothetical protein